MIDLLSASGTRARREVLFGITSAVGSRRRLLLVTVTVNMTADGLAGQFGF